MFVDNSRFHKKILRKIKPLINAKDRHLIKIERIKRGNSTAQNFCISIENTPTFFAKVYDKKIRELPKLKELSKQKDFFLHPFLDFRIGSKRCMVINWVEATEITGTFSEAYQVAKILKAIHSQKPTKKCNKNHIRRELKRYLFYLQINRINTLHMQEIVSYLLKNINLCRDEFSLTHMDVHQKNFIIDSDNIVRLIDYENLSITDPWRDFVYACFFHDREETPFWEAVINNYFNNNIPEDFWITMKYYCYLHLLRMIICEHQKGSYETIDMLVNSIWLNWNCNNDVLPKWRRLN